MLTFFSVPKPCIGHIGVIQRNAVHSWKLASPDCRIVLCGNDLGVAELAAEVGAIHLPDVRVNNFGTPLLSSVFEQVAKVADTPLICYVNADIILFGDLFQAIRRVRWEEFLLIGRRIDFDLRERLDFANPQWKQALQADARSRGVQSCTSAIDFMVFPRKSALVQLPDFAVGRPAWDNWFVHNARNLRFPVIDASPVAMVIHQNHDYRHVPQGTGHAWEGPEALANRKLADFDRDNNEGAYTIRDATYRMTASKICRCTNWSRLFRRVLIRVPFRNASFHMLFRAFHFVTMFSLNLVRYITKHPDRALYKLSHPWTIGQKPAPKSLSPVSGSPLSDRTGSPVQRRNAG